MVNFHLYFPQHLSLRGQKGMLIALYTIALLGGLPYLALGVIQIRTSQYFTQYTSAAWIFLAVNSLAVVALLFYSYQHATTPGARGKIRIVVLGGVLSLFPLITMALLPMALFQQTFIPYAFSFIFLAILPLTYCYAIFRHRLVEIERHVNRGATIILVFSILGAIYLILYVILDSAFTSAEVDSPEINTILVLVLAVIFSPLHRFVQKVVDTAFYGGWYDYRSAITQITQGLEQITNLNTLAETVSGRLVKTLRLEESCVFLSDLRGTYSIVQVAPRPPLDGREKSQFMPLPRSSLSYLLHMGEAVERTALKDALHDVKLSKEELALLNSEQVYLWVPVIGHGQVLGLLALGPKFGGDVFSGEDMDILRVVARQLSPLIENIHLVTRLRRYASELERRVSERTEELAASKKRVEAILSSVGEGVVVIDLDGNIVTVNAACEEQSGCQATGVGEDIWKFYCGEHTYLLLDEVRDSLLNQRTWMGELVGCRKSGLEFDVQITFTPLRDENNRIIGYVGSQRDVTKQKELDRLKDLFVSDVSHELRTPTTNISLYLELLENASLPKRNEYLGVLREQTQLLMKLVEDILDLSRLAMGRSRKIEFIDVSLNDLVEQVVTAHRPLADASGLDLIFTPAVELPLIWGEPNQLARVINNLVTNAIHYTAVGGVYVRTYQEDENICLEVRDSGMGIEPSDKAHIYERFYRGQRVRQSKIHGTGLGLAIVKDILDLHESQIEFNSEVGKGSCFIVRFPLEVKEAWLERSYSS
jgi:PAS domain S-box-containing protein